MKRLSKFIERKKHDIVVNTWMDRCSDEINKRITMQVKRDYWQYVAITAAIFSICMLIGLWASSVERTELKQQVEGYKGLYNGAVGDYLLCQKNLNSCATEVTFYQDNHVTFCNKNPVITSISCTVIQ